MASQRASVFIPLIPGQNAVVLAPLSLLLLDVTKLSAFGNSCNVVYVERNNNGQSNVNVAHGNPARVHILPGAAIQN